MYTTEELIKLCEASVVPVEKWWNRDSANAQKQVGQALMLLRAGAEWRESEKPVTNENTIWINITYPGFNAFEYGRSDRQYWVDTMFYIPTEKRLKDREGDDWH